MLIFPQLIFGTYVIEKRAILNSECCITKGQMD